LFWIFHYNTSKLTNCSLNW